MIPALPRLLLSALLLCGAVPVFPAAAQAADPAPPVAKSSGLQVRAFMTHAPREGLPGLALLNAGRQAVPLPLVGGALSAPVSVAPVDRLQIYDRAVLEKALADKASLPAPLADLPILLGVSRYILALQPAEGGALSCILVGDDAASSPGGTCLFFNTTAYPFTGTVGTAQIDIPPHGRLLFAPVIPPELYLDVLFQTRQDGELKPFLRQRWMFDAQQRSIVAFWDMGNGTVRTLDIGDGAPSELPKASFK